MDIRNVKSPTRKRKKSLAFRFRRIIFFYISRNVGWEVEWFSPKILCVFPHHLFLIEPSQRKGAESQLLVDTPTLGDGEYLGFQWLSWFFKKYALFYNPIPVINVSLAALFLFPCHWRLPGPPCSSAFVPEGVTRSFYSLLICSQYSQAFQGFLRSF